MKQKRYGFTLKSTRDLAELGGKFHELEHEKTGARLVWLERAEENKTFAIAFQTQPWDDTGVFHILEHSVLCGSERYPVKEPFVELMKSSLNTFLNAMTFPDKTIYPVSSRNGQDFVNLMRVYLDAVFRPLLHGRPEIFGQEGWHYELGEDGTPSYKGVVFNEMKGAFASPDTLLNRELSRRLFPDTCYRFESGGHPAHIPELSYEQFAAAHKRLYHPSNAYIFLDGNVDIDQALSLLDGEYLSAYDRAPAPPAIPMQAPVDGGTAEIFYELSPQEGLEGRARLAQGFAACTFRDREVLTALQILSDLLCGDNQAPLKRALLESGLAKDVQMSLQDGILQPWVLLEARDMAAEGGETVSAALRGELERLARGGLDRPRILAALDNLEFQMRERDYGQTPQGVVFSLQVMESWLYGGDPMANLSVGALFDALREKCAQGYFESLLRRVLLDNPHTARVLMLPSHDVGRERQEAEAARLRAAQAAWSEEDAAAIRDRQAGIEGWQNTPDAPEQLASIPMLRLDQIPEEPEALPAQEEERAGLPVLRHTLTTGGITYLNLYFDAGDLTPEELTQAAFLCQLLGELDTTARDSGELQRLRRSLFGDLEFSVESYGELGAPERCRAFLCASASMLDGKAERAAELLAELLTDTLLNDPEKVRALLCQRRAALSEQLVMAGHRTAVGRAAASCTAEGAVQEYTGGIAHCRWLKELETQFEERFPALREALAGLSTKLFCRRRLTAGVTASGPETEGVLADILSAHLPEGAVPPPEAPGIRPWERRREGIVIPADVSFAAMGGAFPQAASGGAKVMGRAASLGYLWNAVRVQGGAYGVGMVLRDSGLAGFWSFRDPSACRTLDCYRQTADFLAALGDMDLTGLILGAVAESDPLLTPRMKGKTADARHWRGITHGDLRRVRRELLAAKPETLAGLAEAVRTVADTAAICVLGPRRQLEACGAQLDILEEL